MLIILKNYAFLQNGKVGLKTFLLFAALVPGVSCNIFTFFFYFSDKVVELVCGGSVINGAYPVYLTDPV